MATRNPLMHDPIWLTARYLEDRMSLREVARAAGVPNDNMATARRALLRFGIPIRSISEGRRGRAPHNKGQPMSEEQKRLLSQVKKGRPSALTAAQREALSQKMQAVKGTNPAARHRAGRREARRLYPVPEPCARCGELRPNIHRHHRNEDTWDNRQENVEWLCAGCHRRGHTLLPAGVWNRAGLTACTGCERSDREHLAGGLCARCYTARRRSAGG